MKPRPFARDRPKFAYSAYFDTLPHDDRRIDAEPPLPAGADGRKGPPVGGREPPVGLRGGRIAAPCGQAPAKSSAIAPLETWAWPAHGHCPSPLVALTGLPRAPVVELVDATDSKSVGEIRAGSTPARGTNSTKYDIARSLMCSNLLRARQRHLFLSGSP